MKLWLILASALITAPAWIALLVVILIAMLIASPIVWLFSRKGVRND